MTLGRGTWPAFNMRHTQKERKAIPIGILSCQSAIRLPVEIVAKGKIVKVTEQAVIH